MGQYTEDVLSGLMCDQCGQLIDFQEPGFPRTCKECDPKKGYKLKDYPPKNSGWKRI